MPPSGIGLERSSIMRPLVFSSICQGLPKVGQAVEHGDPRLRRDVAALGEVAQDPVERDADLAHLVGQVEQRAILPVPAGQPEILVEDGDALLHLVERDLQQVAVVLQRLGGVVEQAERVLRRAVVALEQQRQDQPRRGRADRAGQQLLGKADRRPCSACSLPASLAPLLASKVWNERSVRSTPR